MDYLCKYDTYSQNCTCEYCNRDRLAAGHGLFEGLCTSRLGTPSGRTVLPSPTLSRAGLAFPPSRTLKSPRTVTYLSLPLALSPLPRRNVNFAQPASGNPLPSHHLRAHQQIFCPLLPCSYGSASSIVAAYSCEKKPNLACRRSRPGDFGYGGEILT